MKKISLIPYSPSRLDSLTFLNNNLPKYIKSSRNVIDIGYGKLFFFNFLSENNFKGNYLGIDILKPPKMQKSAIKTKFIKSDFLKYPLRKKFDFSVCLWVLEHIEQDKNAIKKISNITKPNGIAVIAVPSIWSWPYEFGKHGFHYYSLKSMQREVEKNGFKIKKIYRSSGFFGSIFMVAYNWPRYFLLIPAYLVFQIGYKLNLISKPWKIFSKELIANTIYYYHCYPKCVQMHNKLANFTVKLDKQFKIFPSSYILIMKRYEKSEN